MDNPNIKKTARTAGILYLLMGLTGMYGLLIVPTQLITPDAHASAQNILQHELLFRTGIVSQLACQVIFVYTVLALNRLLKQVNEQVAKQMVTLVVVAVPIAFLNVLNQLAMVVVLNGGEIMSTFSKEQSDSLLILFFRIYQQGVLVVEIFWGLWLLPFGWLVAESKFIPRIFGYLLFLGGTGYVVASLTGLLFPAYGGVVGSIATIPSGIGEFAIIFFLLIKGTR